MPDPLSIVVVEKDRERAQLIIAALRAAGVTDVFVIAEDMLSVVPVASALGLGGAADRI